MSSKPSYHRDGKLIPLNIELTSDKAEECFILHLNHREYPLHATELFQIYEQSKAAMIEWFRAMPDGGPELALRNSPEFAEFAAVAASEASSEND